jgi:hypothetical protein
MKYMFALVDYWILGEPLRRRAPEVRSRLASGYALHHLRASPLRVLPFGGSAAIPLASRGLCPRRYRHFVPLVLVLSMLVSST